MILDIHQIKEGVVEELKADYSAEDLDLEFVDFHYKKRIFLEGFAERILHTLTFRGTLSSEVEQICARCLESVTTHLSTPFVLTYNIGTQETIDTTDELRDALLLLHPDRFLCRSDCRGICPSCGINLNTASCKCPC